MKISDKIKYVGVNDREIDLFEGQYAVPNGMAYNSYVILDEKIAVIDTVDARFTKEWLENIKEILGEKAPTYLVVQHMEPDHSANILSFVQAYPETVVVSTAKAFSMMKNFYAADFGEKKLAVAEGDTLCLGEHTLTFYTAPMVHWPEVMVSYESTERVLFSADAFGKFGALDADEEWVEEARRYYIGIVGKYGAPVQALLKKASGLEIKMICPLHGPVLRENLASYLALYDTWSSYRPEKEGVVIAYTSVYGNTARAVKFLAEELKKAGCPAVVLHDLARTDMSRAVADAFCYSKLLLATTTYNTDIFPFMREFIHHLAERNFCNRTVALIENGSWAPLAAKVMRGMLEGCKNLTFAENTVRILSAPTAENEAQLTHLAAELCR